MKVKELLRLLEARGWKLRRQSGSHRQYRNPNNPNVVTVAGKLSDDVPVGTLGSILKSAGIDKAKLNE